MLTPVFKIHQTDEQIIIEIYAPYANVKDTEAEYCDKQFFFSSKPYYLRLYLPGDLSDVEPITSTYNCDKGYFVFKAMKKNAGEFFPKLDLINELLKPLEIHAKRLVEEYNENDILTDFLIEPQVPQAFDETTNVPMDDKCYLYGYGFAYSRHGIIGKFSAEIGALLDLENPENSLIDQRAVDCLRHDKLKFNAEHYIADMFENNPLLDECLQFTFPSTCFQLSFESRDQLKELSSRNLPNYSIDMEKAIGLSLVDVLFAYLYDIRTTNAEHSSESGWTIIKLSPTLSYFVKWKTAKEALIGSVRRSLCYPLYRHWDLSMKVLEDTKSLFKRGKVSLLQCLADLRTVLSTSGEYRYLLNDLYITDYCLWIQHCPDELIIWLQSELEQVVVDKSDIQLDLEEIELEAKLRMLGVVDSTGEPEDSDDDCS